MDSQKRIYTIAKIFGTNKSAHNLNLTFMREDNRMLDYKSHLIYEFKRKQRKNPSYSLRAFARDIDSRGNDDCPTSIWGSGQSN